ncbi:MAG: DUF2334 domain-containing protein [Blastocatellia bacterium]
MNPHIAQLESALAQRARPLRVFLRDDDAATDEPALRNLLALCLRRETPISLAVIPGLLTTAGVELLAGARRAHPHLIEVCQHGWRHVNHEHTGKKCEFGPDRDFDAQLADIGVGQARMNDAFADQWTSVFVPPWNRCTETTARALEQLGFRALSRDAGQAAFPACRLPEIPVTLDLYRWRGGATLRAPDDLAAELQQQILNADQIGLLLHHQVMDDTAMILLEDLLRLLSHFPLVGFHTFDSLLRPTSA